MRNVPRPFRKLPRVHKDPLCRVTLLLWKQVFQTQAFIMFTSPMYMYLRHVHVVLGDILLLQ